MFHQELFEVDMMNINLKKIRILEPKVKITTGLKTIAREPHSGEKEAKSAIGIETLAGVHVLGSIDFTEE